MMASCGILEECNRTVENTAAPRNVNPRLIQYAPVPCGANPANTATVVPNAAICASDRSTKITPRSTTWTPKYAWIPVRIRLATKGASRNVNMSMLFELSERRGEQVYVVIE